MAGKAIALSDYHIFYRWDAQRIFRGKSMLVSTIFAEFTRIEL